MFGVEGGYAPRAMADAIVATLAPWSPEAAAATAAAASRYDDGGGDAAAEWRTLCAASELPRVAGAAATRFAWPREAGAASPLVSAAGSLTPASSSPSITADVDGGDNESSSSSGGARPAAVCVAVDSAGVHHAFEDAFPLLGQ